VFPLANSIGRPTSLAAVADAVCIGGSSGATACLPLACFTDQLSIRNAMQLAPASDGIVNRLGRAFWGGATQPAVVDLAPAPFLGLHMLMALYADASLRFWDTKVRQHFGFRAMPCQHRHVGDRTLALRVRSVPLCIYRRECQQPQSRACRHWCPTAAHLPAWRRCGCVLPQQTQCARCCWRWSCRAAVTPGWQPPLRCSRSTSRDGPQACSTPPPCRCATRRLMTQTQRHADREALNRACYRVLRHLLRCCTACRAQQLRRKTC
jgi:hypothetical protein